MPVDFGSVGRSHHFRKFVLSSRWQVVCRTTCHPGIQKPLYGAAETDLAGTLFESFAGGFQGFAFAHLIGAFGDLGNAGDCGCACHVLGYRGGHEFVNATCRQRFAGLGKLLAALCRGFGDSDPHHAFGGFVLAHGFDFLCLPA